MHSPIAKPMRPRKEKPMKIYEYCVPSVWPNEWFEVEVKGHHDEFDAAEEAAERVWNNMDSDGTNAMLATTTQFIVRLKGSGEEDMHLFEIDVETSPLFHVSQTERGQA